MAKRIGNVKLNGSVTMWKDRYTERLRLPGEYGEFESESLSRTEALSACVGLICLCRLGLIKLDEKEVTSKAAFIAEDYFKGEWWKGNKYSTREMNVEKYSSNLKWFKAFYSSLFLCLLGDNFAILQTIANWPKSGTRADFCKESQESELGSVYKLLAIKISGRGRRGVKHLEGKTLGGPERRPRQFLRILDAVEDQNQEMFEKALQGALAPFCKRPARERLIAEDWVDVDASVFALYAIRGGLHCPKLGSDLSRFLIV